MDNRFRAERERAMFLSLPYSSQAKHLRVCSIFRQTASLKHNIEVLIGWSVKLNTMRRLYRLNWPYAPVDSSCMQGMGSGWRVFFVVLQQESYFAVQLVSHLGCVLYIICALCSYDFFLVVL